MERRGLGSLLLSPYFLHNFLPFHTSSSYLPATPPASLPTTLHPTLPPLQGRWDLLLPHTPKWGGHPGGHFRLVFSIVLQMYFFVYWFLHSFLRLCLYYSCMQYVCYLRRYFVYGVSISECENAQKTRMYIKISSLSVCSSSPSRNSE